MEKKLYRSPDKKICGVCAGMADYFNIDASLVRIIALVLFFYTAVIPMTIAYLIAAAVIPAPNDNYYQIFNNTSKRLVKSRDKKIAGVCGGVAEYFGFDPTIVRLIYVLAVLVFGSGLMLYIVCAIVLPNPEDVQHSYNGGNYYNQNQNYNYNYQQSPNENVNQGYGYQQNPNTNNQNQQYNYNNQNQGDPMQGNQNPQGYTNGPSQAGDAFDGSNNNQ